MENNSKNTNTNTATEAQVLLRWIQELPNGRSLGDLIKLPANNKSIFKDAYEAELFRF